MLCPSLSSAIWSCCSFNSFLCCVMICCWTACLFSNLLPGNAALIGLAKLPSSTLCRAWRSSAAIGAAWRRVTCHGCVGWATVQTGVLFCCTAEALWAEVPDLCCSSYRGRTDTKIIYEKDQTCPRVQVCRKLRGDIIDTVSSNLILFELQEAWHISNRGLTPPPWITATPTSSLVPFFPPPELCSTILHLLFLHLLYTFLSYIFTRPFLLLHSPELWIFQQERFSPWSRRFQVIVQSDYLEKQMFHSVSSQTSVMS